MAGDPHFLFLILEVQAIVYQLAIFFLKSYPWEFITAIVLKQKLKALEPVTQSVTRVHKSQSNIFLFFLLDCDPTSNL